MSDFLSGEDALRALADHKDVIFIASGHENLPDDFWSTTTMTKNFSIHDFLNGMWVFKLKGENNE
jgi:hypothetical protein